MSYENSTAATYPKTHTEITPTQELQPGQDLVDYVKAYAREKPEVAALWCFGIGFILGWKLKPW